MKKTLLFLLFFHFIIEVKSQVLGTCGTQNTEIAEPKIFSCASTGVDYINKYRTLEFWIPNSETPIKTIKVNIVVTQSTDPNKQLWKDTPFFRESVNTMFAKVNEIYSNSVPNSYPFPIACPPSSINYITDTKIRFILNEIIFLPPNDVFYYSGYNTSTNPDLDKSGLIVNYLNQHYPSAKTSLNHIFSMPASYPGHPWGQWHTVNGVNVVNTWLSMWGNSMYWHNHASHFIHEYGHALGLHHTYDGPEPNLQTTDFDFLNDVFGTCPEPAMLDVNNPCYSTCNNLSIPANQRKCPPPAPGPNRVVPVTKECFYYDYPGGYPFMSGAFYHQDEPFIRYHISPKSAARMHRALSLYEKSFVLDNTIIANCVKEYTSPVPEPYYIYNNETWDFAMQMHQSIVVVPGVTLTLKCKLSMAQNRGIVVMKGAKLIVDGATITSRSGWNGIFLEGDYFQPMNQTGNIYHGYVELKNNAKIEYAVTAINANEGGIIKASNSTFSNNIVSIKMSNYSHLYKNTSSVSNCIFQNIDRADFVSFIDLNNTSGFKVLGCEFIGSPTDIVGYGIKTIDSELTVDWFNGSIKNTFKNLSYGVYSSTSYQFDKLTKITNSNFENNAYGILLEGTQYSNITKNQFVIENISSNQTVDSRRYGLYLKGCNGFNVTDNQFLSNNGGGELAGCVVWNSVLSADVVKKNSFANLTVGAVSSGNNTSSEQSSVLLNQKKFRPGLQFLCNDFSLNSTDIFVGPGINPYQLRQVPTPNPPVLRLGMGSYQGSCVNNSTTANNLFSNGNHIIYDSEVNIGTIYSHPNNVQFTPLNGKYTTSMVTLNNCNSIPNRNCNPKYFFDDIYSIKDVLSTSKSTAKQLAQLIDNNNTMGLLNTIATVSSSAHIKNALIAATPYLSDEVLKTMLQNSNMNHAHVKQIIIGNSPVSNEIKDVLDQVIANYPNGIKNQIYNAQQGVSERSILFSKIMTAEADAQQAINDGVRYYLTADNIPAPIDSVIALLENNTDEKINMQLAAFYIIKHDFIKTQLFIDNMALIPAFVDVAKLFTVAMELEMANQRCNELNQQQKDKVLEVADGACQNSSYLAQALLKYYYSLSYPEYVEMPSNQPQGFARGVNTTFNTSSNSNYELSSMTNEEVKNHYQEFIKSTAKQSVVSGIENNKDAFLVYPNPAKEQITIFYESENDNNNTFIELTDVSGKLILQKRISANESEITISLEKISSGFYLMVIKDNNTIVSTKKLSIEK